MPANKHNHRSLIIFLWNSKIQRVLNKAKNKLIQNQLENKRYKILNLQYKLKNEIKIKTVNDD